MAISERRMKTAIKKYNDIMYQLALDHLVICDKNKDWTLRDMVSECQYQLDLFSEYGTSEYEALHVMEDYKGYSKTEIETTYLARRYKEDIRTFQCAKRDMKDLRKFINKYKNCIGDIECHSGHSSVWD